MSRRSVVFLAAACVFLPPTAFYGAFEKKASAITKTYALPRTERNSVKHAYTAAAMYTFLHASGMEGWDAQAWVLSLGHVNERIERYVKIGKKDSPAETRKDLHNNWAGIVAAQWRLEARKATPLSELIAGLARGGALMPASIPSANEPDVAGAAEIEAAQQWLEQKRPAITGQVIVALERMFP